MFERCTARKERKKCVCMGLNIEAQKVSKRNCWVRDRELYGQVQVHAWYQCTLAHDVNVLGNPPGFDCSRSVSILARRSPPNTPRASETVATSCFTRHFLCFTHIWWTAEFGARELAIVPNQLAKWCQMKWKLNDDAWKILIYWTHANFLYYTGNSNKRFVIWSKLETAVLSFTAMSKS